MMKTRLMASFNLDLFVRVNQELGITFQLDQFPHYALFKPRGGRIKMHLVSLADQIVHLDGLAYTLRFHSICIAAVAAATLIRRALLGRAGAGK